MRALVLGTEFPSVPLPLIIRVLTFYQENKKEVDSYVKAYGAELDRQAALPTGTGVLKVRRQLQARLVIANGGKMESR
jgi:hypothetical protein